ncbi:2-ketoglutarate:ferredoxin oxidoreductase (KGOR), subunit alpha [Vulcanisaeta moutnovskia 768-28]|uniref:2-oxoacid oxidoreductase (ferredoxin) n=1 Tax=Vulcanisaeta moutnovskia (strain 768-28) TaxID=985053 RepID=F0QYW9_VULM7|nr:thiamine pyrophosphate-binding protein [Vulcanisaeta moutnovskia]ADY00250.1 2-ketoglutarate:ferredoxin oxidoreductase (KGOR), subunit alpha [Vulcanisaeta moutnovskia 768-28]
MGRYSLMMGSEALVRGAIYAGIRFYAGYPITPATEIAEYMAQLLPRAGGIFVQTEDELAAINMAIGASVAGWKAMVATSGPGFSLMQEGVGHAINTEVPLLIVDVQRGGPSTGQPTMPSQQDVMQARYGSHGSYEIIVLSPGNVQELFYLTIDAINLSEQYRTPVILLTEEVTVHLWEKIHVPDPEEYPVLPHVTPPTHGDEGFLLESQLHDERGYNVANDPELSAKALWRLIGKIRDNVDKISRIEVKYAGDNPEIFIASYGCSARSALAAVKMLRQDGHKVGFLRLITLWPFPENAIKSVLRNANTIIVPEMNSGYMANEFRLLGLNVVPIPKLGGEIPTPEEIYSAVKGVLP